MTRQEAITAYEKMYENGRSFDALLQEPAAILLLVVAIALLTAGIIGLVWTNRSEKQIEKKTGTYTHLEFEFRIFASMMAVGVLIGGITIMGYIKMTDTAISEEWEEKYGYPYLESLPEIRGDIKEMDLEMANARDKDHYGNLEIYGEVEYYDPKGYYQKLHSDDDDMYSVQENKDLTKPVLSYRVLDKDIGSIDAGKKLRTVEVPEGYNDFN